MGPYRRAEFLYRHRAEFLLIWRRAEFLYWRRAEITVIRPPAEYIQASSRKFVFTHYIDTSVGPKLHVAYVGTSDFSIIY